MDTLRVLIIAGLLVAGLLGAAAWLQIGQPESAAATASATWQPDWRLTRHGWQDAHRWAFDLESLARPIERIHPILWAVNTGLAALFALIWCSTEIQVARFLGHPVERRARSRLENGPSAKPTVTRRTSQS